MLLPEYHALLEDTGGKRRDKFRVTPAMLASAAASVPPHGGVDIVDGFAEPPRVVGRASAFAAEERDGVVALVCRASLHEDAGERVLAPSVTMTGEEWQLRFLRLVQEHKNPRAKLEPTASPPG